MHQPKTILVRSFAALATGAMLLVTVWVGNRPRADAQNTTAAALRQDQLRHWKGNLHTHSLWSDGDDYPEMIADWYKQHRYDFLALTDHNVLSDGERWIDAKKKDPKGTVLHKYRARFGDHWVEQRVEKEQAQVRLKPLAEFRNLLEEPGKFLLIPAEEITHQYAKQPVHLNAINVRDVVKPLDGTSIAETITVQHRQVAEQSRRTGWRSLVFLNHPNFKWGVRAEDMIPAEEMRYFEVYNGHSGVNNYGDATHPGCEMIWDIVLAVRLGKLRMPLVYGLATDDSHAYHTFGVGMTNPGRGFVMVRAPQLTAEAIVKAMQAGDFYFSTGTQLREARREGDRFLVRVKELPGVTYRTQFIATMRTTSLESQARKDESGKPLPVTRVYADDVGKVVQESAGPEAAYRLTGDELYVRAKVISSKPHPNPFQKGDLEVAWTQPVVP